MSLLSLLIVASSLSHADVVRTETLVLSPHARRALVRVHADGVVTIVNCPVPTRAVSDLAFGTVESLLDCRPSAHRMIDTPENVARFEGELEKMISDTINEFGTRTAYGPAWRAAFGYATAAGALHYLIAPFLLKRVMGISISAIELGAGFGVIVGMSAIMVGVTRTWTAINNRHLLGALEEFGVRWVIRPATTQILMLGSKRAFETVESLLQRALERAGETAIDDVHAHIRAERF